MPLRNDLSAVARPILPVFYVLDTSGSMRGQPIGVLNRAMENTINALGQMAAHNSNAQVKIAVMEFNSTCRWIQPAGPEDLEDFFWQDLAASGLTYMGTALRELNDKLSRHTFLSSMSGAYLPVVIFMTDGFANDDYEPELQKILKNRWFAKATRVGFAIGKSPDTEMIAKLTGDSEAVIRTDDLGIFARLLRFVSVSASTLASQSHTADSTVSGAEAVRMALDNAGVSSGQVGTNFYYREDPMLTKDSSYAGVDDNDFMWDESVEF